jgi:hypothetical protein
MTMIENEEQLEAARERIPQFERQVRQIHGSATDGENYRISASSFLAEIDGMRLEIREHLWSLPSEYSTPDRG